MNGDYGVFDDNDDDGHDGTGAESQSCDGDGMVMLMGKPLGVINTVMATAARKRLGAVSCSVTRHCCDNDRLAIVVLIQ